MLHKLASLNKTVFSSKALVCKSDLFDANSPPVVSLSKLTPQLAFGTSVFNRIYSLQLYWTK